MEKYVKQNSFQKHWKLLITKFNLALKENKEYKLNLWNVVLFDIIAFLTYMVFFRVYGVVVNEILNWSNYDFIVYFMLILVAGKSLWFLSLVNFNTFLLSGGLNSFLTKPVNTFFLSLIRNTSGPGLVTFPFAFLILIILILFGNYKNLFFSFYLFIFSLIFYQMFFNFLQSISFFMKRNEFLIDTSRKLIFINEEFTPKMFEKSGFKAFFYLLPTSIFGYFTMEVLLGRTSQFYFYFPYMLIILIIFGLSIYLLWYYGLKKYEAFG